MANVVPITVRGEASAELAELRRRIGAAGVNERERETEHNHAQGRAASLRQRRVAAMAEVEEAIADGGEPAPEVLERLTALDAEIAAADRERDEVTGPRLAAAREVKRRRTEEGAAYIAANVPALLAEVLPAAVDLEERYRAKAAELEAIWREYNEVAFIELHPLVRLTPGAPPVRPGEAFDAPLKALREVLAQHASLLVPPTLAAHLNGPPEPEPAPKPAPSAEPSPGEQARIAAMHEAQEAEDRRMERLGDVLAAKLAGIRTEDEP